MTISLLVVLAILSFFAGMIIGKRLGIKENREFYKRLSSELREVWLLKEADLLARISALKKLLAKYSQPKKSGKRKL